MTSKGFQGFVSSILSDKINLRQSKPIFQSEQPQPSASHQADRGDLDLIQQIQEKSSGNKKSGIQDQRPRGVGLGYEKQITEGEIEANTQIQKLKKQLQRETDKGKDEGTQQKIVDKDNIGKHGIKEKKKSKDNTTNLIEERQEKKRQKKEKQKQKKDKQSEVLKKQTEEAERKALEEREAFYNERQNDQPPKRIRIKTKTRSKQKNKKRDTRPIEVKRAKLAERGIII